jgi:hypothetical protein
MKAHHQIEAPRKTGKWLRDDVPHTGWTCVDVKENPIFCEMCEATPIVYAHVMKHERYPIELYCGCVCAGYMVEDPATEQLRELLYRWRRLELLNRTPIEKLRRRGWHRAVRRKGHVFGWSFGGKVGDSPVDNFYVEISNADGRHFHVYHPWHTEITRSKPLASDIDAATRALNGPRC